MKERLCPRYKTETHNYSLPAIYVGKMVFSVSETFNVCFTSFVALPSCLSLEISEQGPASDINNWQAWGHQERLQRVCTTHIMVYVNGAPWSLQLIFRALHSCSLVSVILFPLPTLPHLEFIVWDWVYRWHLLWPWVNWLVPSTTLRILLLPRRLLFHIQGSISFLISHCVIIWAFYLCQIE